MNYITRGIVCFCIVLGASGCGQSEKEVKLKAELDQLRSEKEAKLAAEIDQLKKEKETTNISCSVFVVAKNGVNYKLALVPITVSSKKEYDESAKTVLAAIRQKLETISGDYAVLKEKETRALSELRREYSSYEKIDAEMSVLIDNLKSAHGIIFDQVIERITIVGYESPSANTLSNASRLVELSENRKREWERIKPFSDSYQDTRYKLSKLKEKADDLEKRSLPALMSYLRDKNGVSEKTDADGNASITVSRTQDIVVITASGSRSVGDSEELYYWKKEVDVSRIKKDAKLLISNGELMSSIEDGNNLVDEIAARFPKTEWLYFKDSTGTFRIERI